jgi:hypothetical protein
MNWNQQDSYSEQKTTKYEIRNTKQSNDVLTDLSNSEMRLSLCLESSFQNASVSSSFACSSMYFCSRDFLSMLGTASFFCGWFDMTMFFWFAFSDGSKSIDRPAPPPRRALKVRMRSILWGWKKFRFFSKKNSKQKKITGNTRSKFL